MVLLLSFSKLTAARLPGGRSAGEKLRFPLFPPHPTGSKPVTLSS